jgi:cytochrome bd-type quinol oxidase subunit 2
MFLPIFLHLSLLPLADIGTAFDGVARLFATFLGGILAFMLVIEGYLYLAAGPNEQKAEHAKRAMGAAVAGGILVAVAVGLAPELVKAFGH